MKIRDIMSTEPTVINLETTLEEASKKMKELDIGSLPVTDGVKIKGMLTDRDIVTRAVAAGKNPADTTAGDVMTENIKYVFEDEDVSAAAESMKNLQIRRLVVLNRDKNLVGFVSTADVHLKSGDAEMTADIAKCCSETPDQHKEHKKAS